MGIVIRMPPRHARASSTTARAGRATCAGHSTPSGQPSENQTITSSYLRAVNVLASSSKRSKKRQSPAASLPIVDRLTERASPYAEAQARRFDRSSDSIVGEDSRNFPTSQAKSVGKFRLAQPVEKSDKSAVPTVDQIRAIIQKALDKKGVGAVTAAGDLGFERNHIREFLIGKKESLKTEVSLALAEYLDIDFNDLVITKEKRQRRIG